VYDKRRFSTLDGLRGVAALLVMLYHAGPKSPVAMPGGYLAVDLFFALSGFVLALAYEPRLRAGLSLGEFTVNRVVRIYPMMLVGAAVGAALLPAHAGIVVMMPDFESPQMLFPANPPMWSLLFELLINLAFAVLALRIGRHGLLWILAVSGATLCYAAFESGQGLNVGAMWSTAVFGAARTIFSFSLGVALFRLRDRLKLPRRETRMAWLLFPVLIAALVFAPADRASWDLACVFLVLPLLLWLGTLWEVPNGKLAEALGDLSYPLYCIHAPLVWAAKKWGIDMATICAATVAGAWALDRWIDRPVRAKLTAMLKARRLALIRA
jgi:peptidoglycan/LPS O-acetylase OafA/YrhL